MALLLALGAGLGYSLSPSKAAPAGHVARAGGVGPLMMPKATPKVQHPPQTLECMLAAAGMLMPRPGSDRNKPGEQVVQPQTTAIASSGAVQVSGHGRAHVDFRLLAHVPRADHAAVQLHR
jgi:hypothetical protein